MYVLKIARTYLKNKHATLKNVYYPENTWTRSSFLFIYLVVSVLYQIIQYYRRKVMTSSWFYHFG